MFRCAIVIITLSSSFSSAPVAFAGSVGVGYGLVGPLHLSHDDGLRKLKDQGVKYLKTWNVPTAWLDAVQRVYGNGNVGVTVAIENPSLGKMASDPGYRRWVADTLKKYDGIIDTLAIGNEPSMNSVMHHILPAVREAKKMIRDNRLQMRLTVPFMAAILVDTYPPHKSRFSDNYVGQIKEILNEINVFSINLYPYFAYKFGSLPVSVATGVDVFKNMVDGVKVALNKVGKGGMAVVVGETGWPTAGGKGASTENAQRYIQSALSYTRSGQVAERVYLFEAFDEPGKHGSGVERNFGIMTQEGRPKFPYNIRS